MKMITTTALALVAATPGTAAIAQVYGGVGTPSQGYGNSAPQTQSNQSQQQQSGPQIKPSSKALKALVDLQNAVKANDIANIPAKVAAAQAAASTPEDHYLIAQLQLQAAVKANDLTAASAAVDAMAGTGLGNKTDIAHMYRGIGGSLYNVKQYDKAAQAYERAVALNPTDIDSLEMLGQSRLNAGQEAQAGAAFQRAIQLSAAAGQKPDESLFKLALKTEYEQKSPDSVNLALQWVSAYPNSSSWSDAVAIYRNLNHPDLEGTIGLYRLMSLTGGLTGPQYAEYARAEAEQGNFNEAQAAFDAGIASKAIDPANPEYRDLTTALRAKPKATAADLAVATKSAVNGMALLRIGDRYYAMGDYAKAVELYKMATGKPGVDAAVANLHVGMALARSGDRAGATAAFNAVTGPRADIAKFWLTYLNHKA